MLSTPPLSAVVVCHRLREAAVVGRARLESRLEHEAARLTRAFEPKAYASLVGALEALGYDAGDGVLVIQVSVPAR